MKHTFAAHCRQHRARLGITQTHLAQIINVSQRLVSCWEVGRRQPSLEHIYDLANVFGVTPCDLITPLPEAPPIPDHLPPKPKRQPSARLAATAAEPPTPEPKKSPGRRTPSAEKTTKTPAATPRKRSSRKAPSKPTAA